jgi:hypothetical protein
MSFFDKFKKKDKDKPPSGGVSLAKAQENLHERVEVVKSVSTAKGLASQTSRVCLVLDISASMTGLFDSGIVQDIVERALALGIKFDDNAAIDVYLFGEKCHSIGELTESDFYGYVQNVIRKKYKLEYDTRYSEVIKLVTKDMMTPGDPAYVMFITDGDNSDKPATTAAVIEAANYGIFWQFIGIGRAGFGYLEKLDDMDGRKVDNANFFSVNDINRIEDKELYERMLNEYPDWLTKAKSLGII